MRESAVLCGTGANYRTIPPLAACLECGGENLQPASISPVIITPSKTRLKQLLSPPMLSHPYGIPPGVVNNLKSQTTTHFITGGTVCITPPRYTTPGDKIPKPKILSPGVWYTLSYTVGQLGVRPNWSIYTSIQQYEYCCTSTSQAA